MPRGKRLMLMSGAAVAIALSLSVSVVAAGDVEDAMASTSPMASLAPMEPTAPMEPGLDVRNAWTRESPMLDLAGAAYMLIHNDTDADDALIGASSPVAEVVEYSPELDG